MSEAYNKLIKTLQALFEMDKADLDFGIYRIMNQKRDEIRRFLEDDLLAQVREAFADFTDNSQAELKKELQAAIEQARKFGAPDPENTEAVREIRQKLASSVDITSVENEVFSHLHTFFSRYYDKGDFISQRRYKKDTYAIPYEGEEVKLYWANHDQYYIKSSEHLRDYAFRLKVGKKEKTARFKLVEADTEKDNVKAESGKERRFVLDADNPLSVENGELHIHFRYTNDPEKRPQTRAPNSKSKKQSLNEGAVQTIFAQQGFDDWLALLKAPAPTEKNPDRTLLEKHLNDYTARNTFDYFIHKDLGGFLRRELDFYIKNEVLFLDDIDDASFQITETHLRKIKVIRSIAHMLIRMLAQLEDFQKKLWLKKKFVVETHYCMTLDRVPEELYGEIVANTAQHEEWVKLGFTTEDTEITEDFLRQNPFLVLDTQFFDDAFKDRLLASIENLDEQCDGLLIHSENFQALNLLREQYRAQVKCVYIDPPYNTGNDGFAYKDSYQHSSWLAMLHQCVANQLPLLNEKSSFFISIDENEVNGLKFLLDSFLDYINLVTVKTKISGVSGSHHGKSLKNASEYLLVYAKDKSAFFLTDKVYDKHELIEFIQEMKEEGKSWKYTSVLCDVDGGDYIKSITDGSGNEIKIYVHKRYKYESVNKMAKEKYSGDIRRAYYENYHKIFRTTNAQSSIRQRVINETRHIESDLLSIKYTPKTGRNAGKEIRLYYKDKARNLITFLSDVVVNEEGTLFKKISSGNLWTDIQYNNLALEGGVNFSNGKKPLGMIRKVLEMTSSDIDISLDYFAGSGTTAHAVINLNREDNGQRKYILVEMGEYFDTVLKPRIQKVVYSKDWKDGKPKPDSEGNLNGISHCFKYLRLESYEDTLNNLILKPRTEQQDDLLKANPALREDYMLGYWLDVETADSPSLLNIDQFENPFDYKLNIATGSVGATRPTRVDLVETFNYLIGLTVKQIDTVRGFRVVTGTNPKDESVLVIWRNLKEKDNAALEAFMEKQAYHPRDTEFDHIYVNGDHTLEDPHSKVKMIEIEFKRLMFDVRDA